MPRTSQEIRAELKAALRTERAVRRTHSKVLSAMRAHFRATVAAGEGTADTFQYRMNSLADAAIYHEQLISVVRGPIR